MLMPPPARRAVLVAHVTFSVGWLGSVAAFLALAVAGVTSEDAQLVRGIYLAAELVTWAVIVPLSLATLLSGLLQSWGTAWGVLRHYWVLAKLGLTVAATGLLLVHTGPISVLADSATRSELAQADLAGLRSQLVVQAAAALAVLVAATALSVFKPRGLTRRGEREQARQRPATHTPPGATPVHGGDARAPR